jgi:hypothetical protein
VGRGALRLSAGVGGERRHAAARAPEPVLAPGGTAPEGRGRRQARPGDGSHRPGRDRSGLRSTSSLKRVVGATRRPSVLAFALIRSARPPVSTLRRLARQDSRQKHPRMTLVARRLREADIGMLSKIVTDLRPNGAKSSQVPDRPIGVTGQRRGSRRGEGAATCRRFPMAECQPSRTCGSRSDGQLGEPEKRLDSGTAPRPTVA